MRKFDFLKIRNRIRIFITALVFATLINFRRLINRHNKINRRNRPKHRKIYLLGAAFSLQAKMTVEDMQFFTRDHSIESIEQNRLIFIDITHDFPFALRPQAPRVLPISNKRARGKINRANRTAQTATKSRFAYAVNPPDKNDSSFTTRRHEFFRKRPDRHSETTAERQTRPAKIWGKCNLRADAHPEAQAQMLD